jgi:hypothetical protein
MSLKNPQVSFGRFAQDKQSAYISGLLPGAGVNGKVSLRLDEVELYIQSLIPPPPPPFDLGNDNFIYVDGKGTPDENGVEFAAAYAEAISRSPDVNNVITVVVAPGIYDTGPFGINLTQSYVNVVTLDGSRSAVFTSSGPSPLKGLGAVAYYRGLDVRNKLFGGGNTVNTIFDNCRGGNFSWTIGNSPTVGTFIDCVGGMGSFGGFTSTGVYIRCVGATLSFAGSFTAPGTADGLFIDCEGGDGSFGGTTSNSVAGGTASGTFVRCTGGNNSFAGTDASLSGGVASGTFYSCRGGSSSFAYFGDASGKFYDCIAGDFSFGSTGVASGDFYSCVGGFAAFAGGGGGDASGSFNYCVAGDESFGGGMFGAITGGLYFCRLEAGAFNTVSGSGVTRYCIDGSNVANNQG